MSSDRLDCDKIRVYVYRLPEDEPRKSTGLKLVKLGLAERYYEAYVPRDFIILDPYAAEVLHSSDRPRAIVVVDRSWKKLMEERMVAKLRGGLRRRLPLLRAANPINYAKLGMLSSAEAVAAALYVLGCKEKALTILKPFKWGQEFLKLNGELLESYLTAKTKKDILCVERGLMEKFHGKLRESSSRE